MTQTFDQNLDAAYPDATYLDTTGLTCPEPVMMLHKAMRDAQEGDVLKVVATDPSTERDIPKFCQFLGHELLGQGVETVDEGQAEYRYWIRKQSL
ncbi:sulfurtransferase TusA [Pseudomaricurvus sp.]|uniref:sulfurtransferase TusA n=1 Tax=Pseudomaricurvus sp. TaxID=2004510 RepID=UPI003F6C1719